MLFIQCSLGLVLQCNGVTTSIHMNAMIYLYTTMTMLLSKDINICGNMIIKYANNYTKKYCSSSNKFLHIYHRCVITFPYFSGLSITSNFGMVQQGLPIEFDFSHSKHNKDYAQLSILKKYALIAFHSLFSCYDKNKNQPWSKHRQAFPDQA